MVTFNPLGYDDPWTREKYGYGGQRPTAKIVRIRLPGNRGLMRVNLSAEGRATFGGFEGLKQAPIMGGEPDDQRDMSRFMTELDAFGPNLRDEAFESGREAGVLGEFGGTYPIERSVMFQRPWGPAEKGRERGAKKEQTPAKPMKMKSLPPGVTADTYAERAWKQRQPGEDWRSYRERITSTYGPGQARPWDQPGEFEARENAARFKATQDLEREKMQKAEDQTAFSNQLALDEEKRKEQESLQRQVEAGKQYGLQKRQVSVQEKQAQALADERKSQTELREETKLGAEVLSRLTASMNENPLKALREYESLSERERAALAQQTSAGKAVGMLGGLRKQRDKTMGELSSHIATLSQYIPTIRYDQHYQKRVIDLVDKAQKAVASDNLEAMKAVSDEMKSWESDMAEESKPLSYMAERAASKGRGNIQWLREKMPWYRE